MARWALAILLFSRSSFAGDPSMLVGTGLGGLRTPSEHAYFSFELTRPFDTRPWGAWATAEIDSEEVYLGGGLCLQWNLNEQWALGLSSGPGWYSDHRPIRLGSLLEFRSTGYLCYSLTGRVRIGVSFSHYSNAGLGTRNPGMESARLFVEFPLAGPRGGGR